MLRPILIGLLFLCTQDVSAQEHHQDTVHDRCTKVIAVSGLNIREKPSKTAKVLGKIPFGHEVKYLSKASFGVDTIRNYPHLFGGHDESAPFKLTGKWAKINYQGKVGYVLDAYLFYQQPKAHMGDTLDYALLYSYTACYTNLYTPSKFHWYGMFSDKQGGYALRKVSINYFSRENEEFGGKDFGVATDNDSGLVVIVGSKKPMKEGKRNCFDMENWRRDNDSSDEKAVLKTYGLERVPADQNVTYFDTFALRLGTRVQILDETVAQKGNYGLGYVFFIGDLDGDQQLDYIFDTDGESGHSILFLSSEKKGENIVEPVAFFFHYYCC